jgi:hypothetical protein
MRSLSFPRLGHLWFETSLPVVCWGRGEFKKRRVSFKGTNWSLWLAYDMCDPGQGLSFAGRITTSFKRWMTIAWQIKIVLLDWPVLSNERNQYLDLSLQTSSILLLWNHRLFPVVATSSLVSISTISFSGFHAVCHFNVPHYLEYSCFFDALLNLKARTVLWNHWILFQMLAEMCIRM